MSNPYFHLHVQLHLPGRAAKAWSAVGQPGPFSTVVNTMSTTIILDCDPGIDDALAITFAAGHPGIELAGITTVAGNVGLARTTRNALDVADFVGAGDVPVTAGCAWPVAAHGR